MRALSLHFFGCFILLYFILRDEMFLGKKTF